MSRHAFWRSVQKRGHGGCWIWTGRTDKDGYGIYRGQRAHRMAYELAKGRITPGKVVSHSCDQPQCVRPRHLELTSSFENIKKAYRQGSVRSPRLLAYAEAGLAAEQRYGQTPAARRYARQNYRARHRRAIKRQAELVERVRLAWAIERAKRLEGFAVLHGSDGIIKEIPIGSRALFYEDLSGIDEASAISTDPWAGR